MLTISEVLPWFDATAFNIGIGSVLVWYIVGLGLGWCFDLIRKS